jgi:alpha-1,2-mannosyltransferase
VSIVAIAGVLISPISWVHHAVWLVPVTGVLLGDGRSGGRSIAWGATMLLFLADMPLWGRAGVPLGPLHVVTDNAFVFALLVLMVLLPIQRRSDVVVIPDLEAAEAPAHA